MAMHKTAARDSNCVHYVRHQVMKPKCVNCKGNHAAFSKECPSWLKEKKVQQVKIHSGVSFVEARNMVQSMSASESGFSFAANLSVIFYRQTNQTYLANLSEGSYTLQNLREISPDR